MRKISNLDREDSSQTYHSSASHQSGWSSTLAEGVRGNRKLCVCELTFDISQNADILAGHEVYGDPFPPKPAAAANAVDIVLAIAGEVVVDDK